MALVACGGALGLVALLRRRGGARWLSPLPAFALFALVFAAYAWLVTQGTFAWAVREKFAAAYDSLARSLRHGSAEVDPAEIYTEAWIVHGRSYMYFGPLPALLRELPDLLAPSLYGRWSRASVFLATLACIAAVAQLARRELSANAALDDTGKRSLFLWTMAAFALGTPLALLGSLAYVYHEAIIWALCAALWGLYFALGELWRQGSPRDLLLLSAAGGVAFLARVTFAVPLFLLAGILGARRLLLARREGRPLGPVARGVALAAVPAVTAVLAQLWYNHARFGGWLQFADFSTYVGARPVGATFSWARVPVGFSFYFGIVPDNFAARAPFVRFWEPVPPESLYNVRDTPLISLVLVSPWILFGLLGGPALAKRAERGLLALGAAPLVLQCGLIFSYYWLAYRFTPEFLPLFVFLHAAYLRHAGEPSAVSSLTRPRLFKWVAGLSVVVTLATLFHFQSLWWGYPADYRRRIDAVFAAIDARLGLEHRSFQ